MIKKILLGLVLLFIIAQFIGPQKNKSENGEAHYAELALKYNIPDDVQSILITACYDCHSDHTRYPWYDNITPVNYMMANHVNEGKEHFNFSAFNTYSPKKLDHKYEEMIEEIEKDKMPLPEYLKTHKDAKLTEEQKQKLIDWAKEKRSQIEL